MQKMYVYCGWMTAFGFTATKTCKWMYRGLPDLFTRYCGRMTACRERHLLDYVVCRRSATESEAAKVSLASTSRYTCSNSRLYSTHPGASLKLRLSAGIDSISPYAAVVAQRTVHFQTWPCAPAPLTACRFARREPSFPSPLGKGCPHAIRPPRAALMLASNCLINPSAFLAEAIIGLHSWIRR